MSFYPTLPPPVTRSITTTSISSGSGPLLLTGPANQFYVNAVGQGCVANNIGNGAHQTNQLVTINTSPTTRPIGALSINVPVDGTLSDIKGTIVFGTANTQAGASSMAISIYTCPLGSTTFTQAGLLGYITIPAGANAVGATFSGGSTPPLSTNTPIKVTAGTQVMMVLTSFLTGNNILASFTGSYRLTASK